jgi:teichuronic acid biosynthesis glycosyltransferase TuaC
VKVLFVTNMWPDEERPWYGAFVKSQADSLEALGVDIDVFPIKGYAGRSAYAGAAARAAGLNTRRNYDVVHAHYGHSGVVARLDLRAPLIVSYCGDDLLGTRKANGSVSARSRAEAAVFRQLARVSAATITKSEEMEAALPARTRVRNHVIPNGVDLDRFRRIDRDEARSRLGWDLSERTVLFLANPAIATKNYPLAAATCERLAESRPGVRLRVAHDFAPGDVPLLLSAADALLFTSVSEGSPNVVKEAMAAELPVVSTPVGDVPERLRGIRGCHVREPEVEALAGALADALMHGRVPEARAAVGRLSSEAVALRIRDLYETVGTKPRTSARKRAAGVFAR